MRGGHDSVGGYWGGHLHHEDVGNVGMRHPRPMAAGARSRKSAALSTPRIAVQGLLGRSVPAAVGLESMATARVTRAARRSAASTERSERCRSRRRVVSADGAARDRSTPAPPSAVHWGRRRQAGCMGRRGRCGQLALDQAMRSIRHRAGSATTQDQPPRRIRHRRGPRPAGPRPERAIAWFADSRRRPRRPARQDPVPPPDRGNAGPERP